MELVQTEEDLFHRTVPGADDTRYALPAAAVSTACIHSVFDPAAPEELLERNNVIGTYLSAETEREYAAFLTSNRVTTSTLGFLVAVFGAVLVLLSRKQQESWIVLLYALVMVLCLAIGIGNYVFCVRGPGDGVWRKNTAFLHEALTGSWFLVLLPVPLSHYYVRVLMLSDKPGGASADTSENMNGFFVALSVFPLTVLAVRPWCVAPPLLLYPLGFVVSWCIESDRTPLAGFLLALLAHTTVTVAGLACHFVLDRQARRRFEQWVLLRRSAAELEERRAAVRSTLKVLLPESVLDNIRADRPLIEFAEQCSVAALRVCDFGRWSWGVHPKKVVTLVSSIVFLSDVVLSYFHVDRLRVVGDLYVVSSGLRQERTATESANNCVRFVRCQARRMLYLSPLIGVPSLHIQCSVGTGWCAAGFVGVRSLCYEGFGEALDVALQLVRVCPPSEVVVCAATRECCGDTFADELSPIVGASPECFVVRDRRHGAPDDQPQRDLVGEPPVDLASPRNAASASNRSSARVAVVNPFSRNSSVVATSSLHDVSVLLQRRSSAMRAASPSSAGASVATDVITEQTRFEYLTECVHAARVNAKQTSTSAPASDDGGRDGSDSSAAARSASSCDSLDATTRVRTDSLSGDASGDAGASAGSPQASGRGEPRPRLFDNEELALLTAQLAEPRPWWRLAFREVALETQFAAYCRRRDRHDGTLATLFALTFSLVALVVLLAECWHTWRALGLACCASASLAIRLLVRRWLHYRLPAWEGPASFGVYFILFGAAVASARPATLLLSRCDWFFYLNGMISQLWCRRVSWVVISCLLALQCGLTAAIEYRTQFRSGSSFHILGPVAAVAGCYATFLQERDARRSFGTYALAQATHRAAHTELLLHRGMLHLVLPSFAVDAVEKRVPDQFWTAVCTVFDLCTMALRFNDAAPVLWPAAAGEAATSLTTTTMMMRRPSVIDPEAILRGIERRLAIVDDAVAAVRKRASSDAKREGLCFRLRACGDEALLAGPLRASTGGAETKLLFEDSAQAARDLVDIAAAVMQKTPRCTAVLACDDGLVAVFGMAPPIVDASGTVMRTVAALMDAAPIGGPAGACGGGSLYVTDSVQQMMATCQQPLPSVATRRDSTIGSGGGLQSAFSFRGRQRWRLRSSGVTFVSLYVSSAMCNAATESVSSPTSLSLATLFPGAGK